MTAFLALEKRDGRVEYRLQAVHVAVAVNVNDHVYVHLTGNPMLGVEVRNSSLAST
ncbi:MAG: hypothetical protein HY901_19885 [Deltaproteobacteria bacterium]|nr:hypothetical protein [Deltaproteobacteria bacterium]